MTEREFVLWLRGYIGNDNELSKSRVDRIREYLKKVDIL